MYFLEKGGGSEGMNTLKTKAYEQIHISAFYAIANKETVILRNTLAEQSPHSQKDFATDSCLRLCSAKITKAPEKMQVAYSKPTLPESEGPCWREKKAV